MITSSDAVGLYRTPAIFMPFTALIAAESTRHGGVSRPPYASLNLGINTADSADDVNENRRRFLSALGASEAQLASSHQVHGTEVLYATEAGRFTGFDALVTNVPGLLVGVTVADCVPVLLYDSEHQAVAAIHAGWRGTVGNIVTRTLEAMQRHFGTQASHCYAYIGTCIDACSFEVGPEVAEQFAPSVKRMDAASGKGFVDLKAANFALLTEAGIPAHQIEQSIWSTVTHNTDYFSYRAEQGQTGRMLAVIGTKA